MAKACLFKVGDKVVYDYKLRYPNGVVKEIDERRGINIYLVEHTNGMKAEYWEGELRLYDEEDMDIEMNHPELCKYEHVVGKAYGTILNIPKLYCDKESLSRLLTEIHYAIDKAFLGKKFMYNNPDDTRGDCVLKIRVKIEEDRDEQDPGHV